MTILYEINSFIHSASDGDVAALYSLIVAEHALRQANKQYNGAVHDFMKYMEGKEDCDKTAYELCAQYVDRQKVKGHDPTLSTIGSVLTNEAYNAGITSGINLIRMFREKTGKGLAESKHHIEKAIATIAKEQS